MIIIQTTRKKYIFPENPSVEYGCDITNETAPN